MMISTQITTKLFAALVLSQLASATPDVPHAGMVARDFFFFSRYEVFGPSGEPDIAALEAAMPIAFDSKNGEGLKDWLPILLGFHKCTKDWGKSLFKDDPLVPRENLTDGVATVLPYDPETKEQRQTVVKLDSMEQSLKLVHDFDFPSQKETAWWPWALLEASQTYANDKEKLDIAQSIEALSGVEVVVLETNDIKEKYKDKASITTLVDEVFSKVESSPIWLQWEENGNYSVALTTYPTAALPVHINISYFDFPGKEDAGDFSKLVVRNIAIDDPEHAPRRIIYLKDMPAFNSQDAKWGK